MSEKGDKKDDVNGGSVSGAKEVVGGRGRGRGSRGGGRGRSSATSSMSDKRTVQNNESSSNSDSMEIVQNDQKGEDY